MLDRLVCQRDHVLHALDLDAQAFGIAQVRERDGAGAMRGVVREAKALVEVDAAHRRGTVQRGRRDDTVRRHEPVIEPRTRRARVRARVALAGCEPARYSAGLETTVLAATINYECEGGTEMRVERDAEARSARATVGSRSWTLMRVDSAAQEKYSEGGASLYLEGEIATLESDGRLVGGKCQSKVPMPKAPTMRVYDLRTPTF